MAEYSGFGTADPGVTNSPDAPESLGLMFKTSLAGQTCTGGRFWVTSAAAGSLAAGNAEAALYAVSTGTGYPTGSPLASAFFGALAKGAWNEVRWTGIALTANTVYCMVIWCTNDLYGATNSYFAAADVTAPSGAAGLVFPKDAATNHNGCYHTSGTLTAPDSTFGSSYYGGDVLLTGSSAAAPAPAPQVVTRITRFRSSLY